MDISPKHFYVTQEKESFPNLHFRNLLIVHLTLPAYAIMSVNRASFRSSLLILAKPVFALEALIRHALLKKENNVTVRWHGNSCLGASSACKQIMYTCPVQEICYYLHASVQIFVLFLDHTHTMPKIESGPAPNEGVFNIKCLILPNYRGARCLSPRLQPAMMHIRSNAHWRQIPGNYDQLTCWSSSHIYTCRHGWHTQTCVVHSQGCTHVRLRMNDTCVSTHMYTCYPGCSLTTPQAIQGVTGSTSSHCTRTELRMDQRCVLSFAQASECLSICKNLFKREEVRMSSFLSCLIFFHHQ
jgi:hypothetical protein